MGSFFFVITQAFAITRMERPEWMERPVAVEIFDGSGVVGVGRMEFDGSNFTIYEFCLRENPSKSNQNGMKLVKTTDYGVRLQSYKWQGPDELYVEVVVGGMREMILGDNLLMYKGYLARQGKYYSVDIHATLNTDVLSDKTFQVGVRSITQDGIAWKSRYIPNVDLITEPFQGEFEKVIG